MKSTIELASVAIDLDPHNPYDGSRVFAALLRWAEQAVAAMHKQSRGVPTALLGRLRGNQRGLHFSELVARLESDHHVTMQTPFEGSLKVSGAVWVTSEVLGASIRGMAGKSSLAKLRWEAGADDLPMHVHDHSDRCIIVLEGRGFFHVTDESADEFSGSSVRTIPARERDVFLFSRGVVHTFSTLDQPMTLLSCQLPFFPFDHPDQYRLPRVRWTAATRPDNYAPKIGTDACWQVLAETVALTQKPQISLHDLIV